MSESASSHTTAMSWRRLSLSKARLKAISRTSALLSGFAMVAMVEVQIDGDGHGTGGVSGRNSSDSGGGRRQIPDSLLVVFSVCTTLLVTIHLVALMISTCILPNLEAIGTDHTSDPEDVSQSPHEKMRLCVDAAWICSTGLGILLFLLEISLLCWVKFYSLSPNTAKASTTVVVPAAILFIAFSLLFYRRLMAHKHERQDKDLRQLEVMLQDINHDTNRSSLRHHSSLRAHLV